MASKTVLETLEAARKLITPRKAWIKNALAETSQGLDIDPWKPEACRWCSAGALLAACGGWNDGTGYDEALAALEELDGVGIISRFNDTHTHKQVLAAFDAAIEKAKVTA